MALVNLITLNTDCQKYIINFIDEKSFINLVKVSKSLNNLSNCKPITNNYRLDKIKNVINVFIFTNIQYNQELFDPLLIPKTVKQLNFFDHFNSPFHNLPDSITFLRTGNWFNHSSFILPQFLVELHLGSGFKQQLPLLPSTLKILMFSKIGKNNNALPHPLPQLTHLTLSDSFCQSIDDLPDSITNLQLGDEFKIAVNKWPKSLKTLRLPAYYQHKLINLPIGPIIVYTNILQRHTEVNENIIWKFLY